MRERWLQHAREIDAIARTGMHWAESPFDRERYEAMHKIAVDMLAMLAGAEPDEIAGLLAADSGHVTPKIETRAVVVVDGRLLLVAEQHDAGRWTLPGGFCDVNESPAEAVARETLEETGYVVRPVKLAALYERERHGHEPPHLFTIYKAFLVCELTGGIATDSHETAGASFFDPSELPELSLGRVTVRQIARMLEHVSDPSLPADFD